ncbi:HGxxPAAW family protein [Sanguibacter sp. Z1732]|uniref:HGxxPAAW family protein n=1 Tax=Sanguibacter sp. Z1732 TaxID=3435412 RepID=UPI003D9CA50F
MSNSSQYPPLPPSEPPSHAPHANHGGTPAGWALMGVSAVGAVIVAIGIILPSNPVILAGVIVLVVGAVISLVLRGLGMGQPSQPARPDPDDELAHLRSPGPIAANRASPTCRAPLPRHRRLTTGSPRPPRSSPPRATGVRTGRPRRRTPTGSPTLTRSHPEASGRAHGHPHDLGPLRWDREESAA